MANPRGKQAAATLPAGNLNVWQILERELVPITLERPENSVTSKELAERQSISEARARCLLAELTCGKEPKLRAIDYRTQNGRRAKCYVPVE